MLACYEQRFGPLDAIQEGDLEMIAQPLDFLGVNFYRPNYAAAADDGSVLDLARRRARRSSRRRWAGRGARRR